MTNPAKTCAAFCALLFLGCSSGPEVVATERATVAPMSDAEVYAPLPPACGIGFYNGQFGTYPGVDGGSSLTMNGDFNFELVESHRGEFPVLKEDFPLQGKSDLGITFVATVKGGGQCKDGYFTSQLVDGHFTVMDGQPTPFDGFVEGQYVAQFKSFAGNWEINLLGVHGFIRGFWHAGLAAQSK
jgi:hypothetical protein